MGLEINGRAVITGAAKRIVFEAARLLQEEDARRLLTDIDEQTLTACVDRLGESDSLPSVAADLSTPAGAEVVFNATDRDVDIVVHSAGVTGAKSDLLTDITEDDWNHAWQTDFMSGGRMAPAFVPPMATRGWGRIAFVTSETATPPCPDEAVCNIARAGVFSVVKAMSHTDPARGVLVDAVAPAFTAPA